MSEDKYLDPTKSVIISAPAGSGKTEKLAMRYISLLKDGTSSIEKILCITFTEKAAAEMKERILNILARDNPELLAKVMPKSPLMRISTIHALCLKILKRFSIELGLDPSLEVMDEHRAHDLWNEAMFDSLIAEQQEPGIMYEIMRDRGLKGWGPLRRHLDKLASKAPLPELLLASGDISSSIQGDKNEGARLLTAYAACLKRYKELKGIHHLLDFNDLELLAAKALATVPNASDILYSFDEHTDHILVDEFQDTSSLQWAIIDKLTEEWRSGRGPKREAGITPTIFLVGDEKQSIYLFRGANVAMFTGAREKFDSWLKGQYNYVEVTDNYRCLPRIVNFTNQLFSVLMNPDESPGDSQENKDKGWGAKYTAFKARREEGEGFVGLMLTEPGAAARETRQNEAASLARHIKALAGRHEIFDHDAKPRPCRYEDMAILLKKRTWLSAYEDALRLAGIPFIVVKGIGFHEEPEVTLLRELVSFIANPSAPYPIFTLLRSAMFGLSHKEIMALSSADGTMLEALNASDKAEHKAAAELLGRAAQNTNQDSLAILIERTLTETGMWRHLGNKQRLANTRKFISLIEAYETSGLTPLEIREKLLRQRDSENAPKANISSEGMDAVKIMTIHAAKGLQFPIVVLPAMDDKLGAKSVPIVFDESGQSPIMGFEEDNDARKETPIFIQDALKHTQEEKRLFYVAVTRARDYLLMSGAPGKKKLTGRLEYLQTALGPLESDNPNLPLTLVDADSIQHTTLTAISVPTANVEKLPVHTEPLVHRPTKQWLDVTHEQSMTHHKGHGAKWTIIGTVLHKILEEVSGRRLTPDDITARAAALLTLEGGDLSLADDIMQSVQSLQNSPLWDTIVQTQNTSYTELPFILEVNDKVYKGRIDRVVISDNKALVYDYKTFPVSDSEIQAVSERYRHQMMLYRTAAERLLGIPARAMLVLTQRLETVEIK